MEERGSGDGDGDGETARRRRRRTRRRRRRRAQNSKQRQAKAKTKTKAKTKATATAFHKDGMDALQKSSQFFSCWLPGPSAWVAPRPPVEEGTGLLAPSLHALPNHSPRAMPGRQSGTYQVHCQQMLEKPLKLWARFSYCAQVPLKYHLHRAIWYPGVDAGCDPKPIYRGWVECKWEQVNCLQSAHSDLPQQGRHYFKTQ